MKIIKYFILLVLLFFILIITIFYIFKSPDGEAQITITNFSGITFQEVIINVDKQVKKIVNLKQNQSEKLFFISFPDSHYLVIFKFNDKYTVQEFGYLTHGFFHQDKLTIYPPKGKNKVFYFEFNSKGKIKEKFYF